MPTDLSSAGYILPAAFLLDLILGDPLWFPHPVRWMGQAICVLESHFRKIPVNLVFSGFLFSIFLILGTWSLTAIMLLLAQRVNPALSVFFEIIIIYCAVSVRSLKLSALAVNDALKRNDLTAARKAVSHIIGRDVDSLSETGVASGAVESVAENLVDGVISPLLFALVGGAPLAMAFKMINTLDSMIGYKNEKYLAFGKAAARIDDMANFIPARLSVPVIAFSAQILLRKGRVAFLTGVKEGANHTSPNAGYPEASFAGALGVKLNGPNYYGGNRIEKPFIGIRFKRPESFHIQKACDLMVISALVWLGIIWGAAILIL